MVLSLPSRRPGRNSPGRHRSGDSALSEPGAMRQYGIILGAEFGVAAAGVVTAVRRNPDRGDHRARSTID